jgi:hypothetical protein
VPWSYTDDAVMARIKDGSVVSLRVPTDAVKDVSPVRALAKLTELHLRPSNDFLGRGQVTELHCLRGLPLTVLDCWGNVDLRDLAPLAGMRLIDLNVARTSVADLAVLKEMPILYMSCWDSRVIDLSPLAGKQATKIYIGNTKITDLSPLKGMKLTALAINEAPIEDLSLLGEMPLEDLLFDYRPLRDAELIRKPTLKTINGKAAEVFRNDVAGK